MAGERDLERRVAGALHDWLDAEPAPHPRWEDAPARSIRPSRTITVPVPLKVLAVAALLAGAAGGALWAGSLLVDDDAGPATATTWCAEVDDYPPVGATVPQPSPGPWPAVGPDTPATGGVLAPGEVAVLVREGGPSALVRVSDPRICDRYPTYRPREAGTRFVVVRLEVTALRDGALAPWIDAQDHLAIRIGDARGPEGYVDLQPPRLPDLGRSASMATPAGWEWAGDVVLVIPDGPAAALRLEYREDGSQLERPALVAWAIGSRPEAPPVNESRDVPTGPITTGTIGLDEWAIADADGIRYDVRVGRLGEVDRYPGTVPARGRFLEVEVDYYAIGVLPDPLEFHADEWRAVDGRGEELDLLEVPADLAPYVLNPLFTSPTVTGGGWLAIDAPPEGRVELEYRRAGEDPVLFTVLVRDGPELATAAPTVTPTPTEAPTATAGPATADLPACATIEDYGEPGSTPPKPTVGPFASVAPDATPTTGRLAPGDTAVLAGADGLPAAQFRVSDVRICDRYPTWRPDAGRAYFVVVRTEFLALRRGGVGAWIDPEAALRIRRTADNPGMDWSEFTYGLPGVDRTASLGVPEGFAVASDAVYSLYGGPATPLLGEWVGSDAELDAPAIVTWDLGSVPAMPEVPAYGPWSAPPDGPPTTGRIEMGTTTVVEDTDGALFGIRIDRAERVPGYPGVTPARGSFVEVLAGYSGRADMQVTSGGLGEWQAFTTDGQPLEIRRLRDTGAEAWILRRRLDTQNAYGWMVIDAPPEGDIVLQFRRNGEGPVRFEVVVRPGT